MYKTTVKNPWFLSFNDYLIICVIQWRSKGGKIMYLQILKKDIKRKVTMNIILFLFVLLSSMFISSSVNNILTIADATDEYLNKAGVKDYLIATLEKEGSSIRENLEDNDYVESFNIEEVLYITYKDILLNGSVLDESDGTSLIMSVDQCGIFLFNEKNER